MLNLLAATLVLIVFMLYVILWYLKKQEVIKEIGKNPKVLKNTDNKVQKYFALLEKIMTISIVIIIFSHYIFQDNLLFTKRIFGNYSLLINLTGFTISIIGLLICRIAQNTIGKSWRVGIDENDKPGLVTEGIFRLIRNPTYSGLFLLCVGVFIILPTILISYWIIIFVISIEFQVRCEEEYLEKQYGEKYKYYFKKTKRYIPYVY